MSSKRERRKRQNILNVSSNKRGEGDVFWLVFVVIVIVIIFSLISSNSTPAVPVLAKNLVTECKTEPADNQAICVENTISKITDSWVKSCVEKNIDAKTSLSTNLNNSKVTEQEMKDIDSLVRECSYYKSTQLAGKASESSPVFGSFVSSVAGAFVWNYIANSLFNKTPNYATIPTSDYRTYSSGAYHGGTSPVIIWNGGANTSGYNGTSTTGKSTGLGKVDAQYKADSWNIKEMKSVSTPSSNYKIGNTGRAWSNVSARSSGGGFGVSGGSSSAG